MTIHTDKLLDIDATVRDAAHLFQNAIREKSLDTVLHITVQEVAKEALPQTKKWAVVAEQLSKDNYLGGEAGKTMRNAIQEFRDNFDIGDSMDGPEKK